MSDLSPTHPLADTPLIPTSSKQLLLATRKQLLSWIVEANKNLASGSKKLNKSDNKEKLCAALAAHYHITLETNTTDFIAVKKEKDPIDLMILQKQLDYRHTLAEEMMRSTEDNPFLLSSSSGHPLLDYTSSSVNMSSSAEASVNNATFDQPAVSSTLYMYTLYSSTKITVY